VVVYHVERDFNLYISNTQRLEGKGSRNMCTCYRKDKKVPDIWTDENNMHPMLHPKELSKMSDTEQMLISRLAPTIHVHMLKHGGIFKGSLHCTLSSSARTSYYFATPTRKSAHHMGEKQGKGDTNRDLWVRRHWVDQSPAPQQLNAGETDSSDD